MLRVFDPRVVNPRHRTPTRPSVSNRYPPLHHMFVAPPPQCLTQEGYRGRAYRQTILYSTCFHSQY